MLRQKHVWICRRENYRTRPLKWGAQETLGWKLLWGNCYTLKMNYFPNFFLHPDTVEIKFWFLLFFWKKGIFILLSILRNCNFELLNQKSVTAYHLCKTGESFFFFFFHSIYTLNLENIVFHLNSSCPLNLMLYQKGH